MKMGRGPVTEDSENCEICGERFTGHVHEEIGEFYDPRQAAGDPEILSDHFIAHAQCGLSAGLELA